MRILYIVLIGGFIGSFALLSSLGPHEVYSHNADTSVDTVEEEESESVPEAGMTEREKREYIRELAERIEYLQWRLSGFSLDDSVSARSYLITNLADGSTLLKKNEQERHPIASISKLMSAVVATENIEPEERITLRPEMLRSYGHSPSLFQGAVVSAYDLLKVSLIQSTNDASESLTYFMDEGTFMGLMNEKAHELGMENSFFYDAHGLSTNNQSTATELTKLLSYIHDHHPEILEITAEEGFQLPNPYGRLLTFRNLNIFHDIPQFIGGKTGYLPEAKQTYAALFDVDGDPHAIVILRSEDRQDDIDVLYNWLRDNPQLQ